MTGQRKRGRPFEPKARLTLSVDVPAGASKADELRAAMAHPDVVAWLVEQRGRGLNCPRTMEVELWAGRKPRFVVIAVR